MEGLRARLVLDDCRAAYQELLAAADRNLYRRRWVTVVTLMRAVGHVLRSADRKRDETHRRVINAAMQAPNPDIFTHFIDKTRSNTIKEYASGAFLRGDDSSPMSYFDASAMASTEIVVVLTASPDSHEHSAPLPFYFRDGRFKYESVYAIIESALEYWENYLSAIETEIAQSSA